ncbi:Heme A synthase [compost metagenome]
MMISRRFRNLAIASCIGMLIVVLAGALVTNTESGRGCGDDWPLCNGKFIPAYTLESMIEYSHRLVTGVEGILVLAVAIAMYKKYKRNREVFKEPYIYAAGALIFTIIQALMGAAAVKWPQSPPVMAIHFGISLIAFATTLLLVVWIYRYQKGVKESFKVPRSVYPRALWTAIYCYVVVYLGAYIRHTDSAGGCEGWPLCNGQVIPELEGATGAVFIHRVAALILGIAIAGLYFHIRRVSGEEKGLTKSAGWALILVVVQIISGAVLTATIGRENSFVFTSLLHNLIITGLFGLLLDLAIRSWRLRDNETN